jgi:hypothetical protein
MFKGLNLSILAYEQPNFIYANRSGCMNKRRSHKVGMY